MKREQALHLTRAALSAQETTRDKGLATLTRIGIIAFSMPRPLPTPPPSVSIIKESDGHYYVSFVAEEPAALHAPATNPASVAGISLGLTDVLASSTRTELGRKIDYPRPGRRREKNLCELKRSLSRK